MAESRVDWAGRNLLIRLKRDADSDRVIARVTQQVGSDVARPTPAQETELVESYRRGEPWLRAGETLQLSRHEAKVLGKSLAARSGRDLDEASRLRLQSILEEELHGLFARIHAGEFSLGEALERAKTEVAPRLRRRLLEFLPEPQADAVLEALAASIFG